MKSRLLIIVLIGIITSSLAILGITYIQFEAELEESIQNSSWVKDCIPVEPNDVVATIGIENKTHHFDLRNCVWLPNNESAGSYKLDENLDVDWITSEDYCGDWCDQNELYRLGCNQPILAHLAKYSNLLDEEFNGKYTMEDIGLSDDVSVEKFNECVDFIYGKKMKKSDLSFELATDFASEFHCTGIERCITEIVTEIIDGDTIRVNGNTVSFSLVFAPELSEEGGKASKKFTEVLCPTGSKILFDQDDLQPIDRSQGLSGSTLLGVVYCNGVNLNEKMAESQYGEIHVGFCDISEFGSNDWARDNGCFEMQQTKDRCLANDHIWNKNDTCTLTTVYPNVSGMGLKYAKYVTGIENEN